MFAPISTAFVSPLPLTSTRSFLSTAPTASPRTPPHITSSRMSLETKDRTTSSSFSRIEENRRAKLESAYRGPQGFTPYAELMNGRLAMMGFFIGLVTELVSGKPIGEQMLIMFAPLTNVLAVVFHTQGV